MKRFNKLLSGLLAFTMMFSTVSFQVSAAETTDIKVIAFNDFHGALKSAGDTDKNMGAAKFVQAIQDLQAANPNSIVVSAGDNYNGTAESNLLYGEPVSYMLNTIGIKASAVGNHEFDWGLDKFPKWQEDMGAPYVAANIVDKATGEPADFAIPYIMEEVDGINIAFLGLTTLETAYKTKPTNVAELTFVDPVETAEEYVPILKEGGADIVILLTHIGTSMDSDFNIEFEEGMEALTEVEGVDAIITAHSHNTVFGMLNGVPVVQAYYNGRSLSILDFVVDKDTKEVVSVMPSVDELYLRKADVTENADVKAALDTYLETVSPILGEVLATTVNGLEHDRYVLSPLGQWTSEVMQASAGADIAMTNGGGLRTSLLPGDITVGNLYEVMPFDNVLSNFNMTGAQVKETLEHGIENQEVGSLQFSGLVVEYIPGAETGSKVVSVKLPDGTEVTDDGIYSVVTNDFMATGGDGFVAFLEAEYLGDTVTIRGVMEEAIKAAGVLDFEAKELLVPVKSDVTTLPATVDELPAAEETPETSDVESGVTTLPATVDELPDVEEAPANEIPAAEETPIPATTKPSPIVAKSTEYIVKSGDVLWKIAESYDCTWRELAVFNSLANPNLIFPGQKILIPAE